MKRNYPDDKPAPAWAAPLFTVFLTGSLGVAFWISLNGTLTQMTERDCRYGIQAACEQLKK